MANPKIQPKIYPALFKCPVEDLFAGTLKEIAGRFGCSPSHIAKIRKVRTGRYFKVYSGIGLSYIIDFSVKYKRLLRKLEKDMIKETNLKVYGSNKYKPIPLEKPYYNRVSQRFLNDLINKPLPMVLE